MSGKSIAVKNKYTNTSAKLYFQGDLWAPLEAAVQVDSLARALEEED